MGRQKWATPIPSDAPRSEDGGRGHGRAVGDRAWSERHRLGIPTSLQDVLQPQGCHVDLLSTAHAPALEGLRGILVLGR